MKRASPARVAVLVGTSTMWGRQIVSGIQSYARRHGNWMTFIEPRGDEDYAGLPPGWRGDGVIARIGRERLAAELRALGRPVVNVSGIELPGADFPRVTTDLEASGRLAAEYFLDRGYRHCCYFSLLGLPYVAAQQQAFAARLARGDARCETFAVRPRHGAEPDWNLDLEELGQWLRRQPTPFGVLTWNASGSREVLYAAQAAGLLVPEDVAVLSGTDDDLFCEFSHIPLSGIRPSAEQIGHRAAALLDRLMSGRTAPAREVLIAPLGITTRRSTDTHALCDPVLIKAMSFIRENAAHAIQVGDVARQAGVSRRSLELRFAEGLRRSPAVEIRRVRLELAKELLHRTDLPIPAVAEASGFGSPEYFAHAFGRELRQTPLRYRRAIRGRGR